MPIVIKSTAPRDLNLVLSTKDSFFTVTLNLVIQESKYFMFLDPPKAFNTSAAKVPSDISILISSSSSSLPGVLKSNFLIINLKPK